MPYNERVRSELEVSQECPRPIPHSGQAAQCSMRPEAVRQGRLLRVANDAVASQQKGSPASIHGPLQQGPTWV